MLTTIGNATDFIVHRKDPSQYKFVSTEIDADLKSDQVLLKVDKFALTANNISYALVGEALGYWDFFPAAEEAWGRIPAWGFAEVVRSKKDSVAEGDRLFGFVPMSTHLILQPDIVSQEGFIDASLHRSKFPPLYNQYQLLKHNSLYVPEQEDLWALFWPLFMSAFVLNEFLNENNFFDTQAILISSASSKTAIGLAFLLSQNQNSQCEVIGLTSSRNLSFVESLGYYNQVLTYDQMQLLPSNLSVVYVDIAGDGDVLSTLYNYFHNISYSCLLGATHRKRRSSLEINSILSDPRPTFFFAPEEIQKRVQQLGVNGFHKIFSHSWSQFLLSLSEWIQIVSSTGKTIIEKTYLDILAGRSKPNQGHILSLQKGEH
ncbi:MAG: DUF2855 family protein [Pelatocladus maniniholoensis HA4357-MV3]|jgi:hypothetical protein|uniref:DUF2855 family protein n=1 Tax=Pelatocladus maniniholoensis HA4357-MV3 TaxID=1117104 RepID=A0A9E3HDA1_9NOST|nr:DUF2855 family protein [Pelatocladus maniniholoensis HA4357-MV3]